MIVGYVLDCQLVENGLVGCVLSPRPSATAPRCWASYRNELGDWIHLLVDDRRSFVATVNSVGSYHLDGVEDVSRPRIQADALDTTSKMLWAKA